MDDIKRCVGIRIGEIRKKKGFTQEQLAAKMEMGPKYLSSIERGRENPTLNTLIALSKALDVDIGEIFNDLFMEDPTRARTTAVALLNGADGERLKLACKMVAAIVK